MKRFVILFLTLLIGFGIWSVTYNEPQIIDGTKIASSATVTDRPMSDGMSYLSVEFADGSGQSLWDIPGDTVPDDISTGDHMEVTYGKQKGFDRYILIDITKDTA